MMGRICRVAASNIREYSTSSRRFSTTFSKDGAQEQHWRYLRNSQNGAEVYLIGTCHASSASASAVKEMIRAIKPSTVALELCEGRARSLILGKQVETFSPKDFLNLPGSFGQKVSSKPLQELLKIFGINYGEEFKVAMEESGKIGAELHYIDQEMDVTLREVKKSLSFLEITKFVMNLPHHASRFPIFFESRSISSIEDFMRDKKLEQQVFQFLEEQFPGAMKAVLHDRNEYMVKQLKEKKGKIVAVVGLAHVDGIEKLWNGSES